MKAGDKFNIREDHYEITKQFEFQTVEGEIMMRYGASVVDEARKRFWEASRDLYPGLEGCEAGL